MGAPIGDNSVVNITSATKIDLYSRFYGLLDTKNELTLAQHVIEDVPVYVSYLGATSVNGRHRIANAKHNVTSYVLIYFVTLESGIFDKWEVSLPTFYVSPKIEFGSSYI